MKKSFIAALATHKKILAHTSRCAQATSHDDFICLVGYNAKGFKIKDFIYPNFD